MATDPTKAKAVQDWPVTTLSKQLRKLLGLSGYFRRFIKNYPLISHPLNLLLKNNVKFSWSVAIQEAFDFLIQALTSAHVLVLPDFSQEFVVEMDVSATGIGAVLLQNGHPIAYISKVLSLRLQSLPPYDREMFVILFAVKKWYQYLMGRHFIINTDH